MNTGPILPLSLDRLIDRSDELLPHAWVQLAETELLDARGPTLWSTDEAPAPDLSGDAPLLAMVHSDGSPALDALVSEAAAGRRAYVLAPDGWQPKRHELLDAPRVFIRRVPEVPVEALHWEAGALLWFGATEDKPSAWRLALDAEQTQDLRRLFLRLFWHDATDEAWTNGGRLCFRTAADRPFDVPRARADATLTLVKAQERELSIGDMQLLHQPNTSLPVPSTAGGHMTMLCRPPGPDGQEDLAGLHNTGIAIQWVDSGLPALAVGEAGGVALLPGSAKQLRLVLSAQQARECQVLLAQHTAWEFRIGAQLGALADEDAEVWLPGHDAAAPLTAEQRIGLPDTRAEALAAMTETEPLEWPAPAPLALTVRYAWQVLPPGYPKRAKEDPLVGQWRQLDVTWRNSLERLATALDAAEGSGGQIKRALSRLMGPLLGFERKHKALNKTLDELQATLPPEVGPSAAMELLDRLAKLESDVDALGIELADAARKQREDQEREKQETAFKTKQDAARKQVPELQRELAELQTSRPALQSKLAEAEAKLAEAKTVAGKRDKKGNSKSSKKGGGKSQERVLGAARGKVLNELKKLDDAVARLTDQIAAHQQTIEATFEFRPPPPKHRSSSKASGVRFKPQSKTATTAPQVPDEALPQVGKLRRHDGQRYLCVAAWGELEAGARDAERLRAKLVGPEAA